ncbi:MAG: acyl-CoA thioesterase/BAAT N-terminal domain-containing protein, partial [Advenella sp.]
MLNEILSVTPADALIDEPRVIRVDGLSAGERITIVSQTERAGGVTWHSQAEFEADAQGVVDVSTQAPLAGSYQGVSQMGLLWSQVP